VGIPEVITEDYIEFTTVTAEFLTRSHSGAAAVFCTRDQPVSWRGPLQNSTQVARAIAYPSKTKALKKTPPFRFRKALTMYSNNQTIIWNDESINKKWNFLWITASHKQPNLPPCSDWQPVPTCTVSREKIMAYYFTESQNVRGWKGPLL